MLTEQDELLSLLDRNLDQNFAEHPRGQGGIRRQALDWERTADTDDLLASLQPSSGEVGGGQGEDPMTGRATQLDFILCAEYVRDTAFCFFL